VTYGSSRRTTGPVGRAPHPPPGACRIALGPALLHGALVPLPATVHVVDDIDWLTPGPDGKPVTLRWPNETGPYLLTCHLARVRGRVTLVGLDVRTFTADNTPGPGGLADVNHPALRSLRAGEIAEAARARLAAARAATGDQEGAAELTAPGPPQSRPQTPGDALRVVASLHAAAVAAGGDSARRPAIYVHRTLVDDGEDVSLAAVRGRIHRARVKGLIPPAP
jgi:hypothetical protein